MWLLRITGQTDYLEVLSKNLNVNLQIELNQDSTKYLVHVT